MCLLRPCLACKRQILSIIIFAASKKSKKKKKGKANTSEQTGEEAAEATPEVEEPEAEKVSEANAPSTAVEADEDDDAEAEGKVYFIVLTCRLHSAKNSKIPKLSPISNLKVANDLHSTSTLLVVTSMRTYRKLLMTEQPLGAGTSFWWAESFVLRSNRRVWNVFCCQGSCSFSMIYVLAWLITKY